MFPFESSPSNKNKWETCNNCFYHSFYNKQLVHFEKIYLFLLLIKARKNSKKKRAQDRQDTNLSRLSCLTCCKAKKNWNGFAFTKKILLSVFLWQASKSDICPEIPHFLGDSNPLTKSTDCFAFWYRFWLTKINF